MKLADLGDQVVDPVTGFKGIVVSSHNYLQGCTRLSVQPKIKKDGTVPETVTFDQPQLDVVKRGKIKAKASLLDPGGPSKYEDEGR